MRYILEFINHIYPHNPVFVAYVRKMLDGYFIMNLG